MTLIKVIAKIFFIILLTPLFTGCYTAEERDVNKTRSGEKKAAHTTQYIEGSNLPSRWSQTAVEIQRKESEVTSRVEAVENRHNPNVIDTIETYTDLDTKLKIYHTGKKKMLMSASIHQSSVLPGGIIDVGSTRSEVSDWLDREAVSNTLIIKDEEGLTTLTITFSRDTVKHIEYHGYVD